MNDGPDLRAQQRAHALLGRLLARCGREGLPAIAWAVAEHGLLTGRCVGEDRMAAFEAWCRALDLGRWADTARPNGVILHQAAREDIDGVDVTLIAYEENER